MPPQSSCSGVCTFINTRKEIADTSVCCIDLESAAGSPTINKVLAAFLSPLPCQFLLPQICLFPVLSLLLGISTTCIWSLNLSVKKIILNAEWLCQDFTSSTFQGAWEAYQSHMTSSRSNFLASTFTCIWWKGAELWVSQGQVWLWFFWPC